MPMRIWLKMYLMWKFLLCSIFEELKLGKKMLFMMYGDIDSRNIYTLTFNTLKFYKSCFFQITDTFIVTFIWCGAININTFNHFSHSICDKMVQITVDLHPLWKFSFFPKWKATVLLVPDSGLVPHLGSEKLIDK